MAHELVRDPLVLPFEEGGNYDALDTVLQPFAPELVALLARARRAAREPRQSSALREALVLLPDRRSERLQEEGARHLSRMQGLGAPAIVIQGARLGAQPRAALLARLDEGGPELGDASLFTAAETDSPLRLSRDYRLLRFLVDPTYRTLRDPADAWLGMRDTDSPARRCLLGHTRCLVDGERLFGPDPDRFAGEDETVAFVAAGRDRNWFDASGLDEAERFFRTELAQSTPPAGEEMRTFLLTGFLDREAIEDAPVVAFERAIERERARLLVDAVALADFFAACRARGDEVGSASY